MPDDYFTYFCEQNPDPREFDERWYEQRKRPRCQDLVRHSEATEITH